MKKKFLVLTLCFTLIFGSLSYKKSYAMDLVVTPSMFYTVSALAVAYGLTITDTDSLYNMSREFFEWSGDAISDTVDIFNSSVSVGVNGVVNVGKSFLDKFNDFLTVNSYRYGDIDTNYSITCGGFPTYLGSLNGEPSLVKSFGNTSIDEDRDYYILNGVEVYHGSTFHKSLPFLGYYVLNDILYARHIKGNIVYDRSLGGVSTWYDVSVPSWNNPFVGQYDDSIVNDNINDDGSLGLVLNPNVDSLIGKVPSDIIYDGTNSNNYDGSIVIPGISDPSINVEGDLSFPFLDNPSVPGVGDPSVPGVGDPSVPNEGIWAKIKDFIIGLVVPSDTFWTDTWGGLYNNFTNSFPMVDMDGFNDLVTGEKKFPNIDIDIMGVKGRVVNGDVVNSIVDWLRPIIAGFMMLCLMFFNYRKIYKLIRNSEPFGGIAPGTSDFNTGISEYSKHEVVKATDMVAEYRAWKERGGK